MTRVEERMTQKAREGCAKSSRKVTQSHAGTTWGDTQKDAEGSCEYSECQKLSTGFVIIYLRCFLKNYSSIFLVNNFIVEE